MRVSIRGIICGVMGLLFFAAYAWSVRDDAINGNGDFQAASHVPVAEK